MDTTQLPIFDPVHDVLHYQPQPLDAIFAPKNVAVIGATENIGSVGRTILWNLISTPFGGAVFPVNPKRNSVLGIKAYPSIAEVPEVVDLAVVVTPAPSIPPIIQDCVDVGVKGAIVISAGFKEIGPQGSELEHQILEAIRPNKMRVIGPNCLGVMNPVSGLNATFATTMARRGNVGFISQSGALCTAVLDWSLKVNVGFSAFLSIGSMLDIGWGDLIYYLGDDPNTDSIVIYMETIGDARAFLSAAREVALIKPIIVIKPGRTAGAAKAAASHTGSLTGSDEVLEAAFRRSGVLRVNSIAELFYMADVLSKQPRPNGRRLTILTNAGGPGVLATDALLTNGGELTELTAESLETYNQLLPAAWSHNNPVDILGDASPERYAKALEIAAHDPNSDGMLVVLTPQAMTDPTQTAELLKPYAQSTGKPVIASWMGGEGVSAGETLLNRAGIPTFPYPDTAARMFVYMAQFAQNLRGLYETPLVAANGSDPDRTLAAQILERAHAAGRTILSEYESKRLLSAYGIPTVETRIAISEDEAVKNADEIGFPVVLKLHSDTITHKTDVGGVQLNLADADAVRDAFRDMEKAVTSKAGQGHFLGVTVQPMIMLEGYELILGSSIDVQLGPVLLFGLGGQLVEVFKDRALGLPPLTSTLARRMMENTRIYTALKGVRGRKPVDLVELEHILVRFSRLIAEQPLIKELDINPLLASPERLLALDARVVLHEDPSDHSAIPRLAIRPYPSQYISHWVAREGSQVTFRPIRPEDEPLIVDFHTTLSDRSVYLRYLHPLLLGERAAHERLSRICHSDYDREITLVAELESTHVASDAEKGNDSKDSENAKVAKKDKVQGSRILAAGRLTKMHGFNHSARFSVLVSDLYQGMGVGKELVRRLIELSKEEKLEHIETLMTVDNQAMRHICQELGFHFTPTSDEHILRVEMDL